MPGPPTQPLSQDSELLTCGSSLSFHPSSFYLTGEFLLLRISVPLNRMPKREEQLITNANRDGVYIF